MIVFLQNLMFYLLIRVSLALSLLLTLSIRIYGVNLVLDHWRENFIMYLSLMIGLVFHGYTSCFRNQKCYMSSNFFCSLIQTPFESKIKIFRSDSGGEYVSNEFQHIQPQKASFIKEVVRINHNKTALLKENIGISWKRLEHCFFMHNFQMSFGLKA